jgi:hypothetical protein
VCGNYSVPRPPALKAHIPARFAIVCRLETPKLGVSTTGYPNDVEMPNLVILWGELNIKHELDDVETPNLGVSTQSQQCSQLHIMQRWELKGGWVGNRGIAFA